MTTVKRRIVLTKKPLSKSTLLKLKREHARSWGAVVGPIKAAIRRSEQITDKDLAIRINARS
jgi:hypothetical protein